MGNSMFSKLTLLKSLLFLGTLYFLVAGIAHSLKNYFKPMPEKPNKDYIRTQYIFGLEKKYQDSGFDRIKASRLAALTIIDMSTKLSKHEKKKFEDLKKELEELKKSR